MCEPCGRLTSCAAAFSAADNGSGSIAGGLDIWGSQAMHTTARKATHAPYVGWMASWVPGSWAQRPLVSATRCMLTSRSPPSPGQNTSYPWSRCDVSSALMVDVTYVSIGSSIDGSGWSRSQRRKIGHRSRVLPINRHRAPPGRPNEGSGESGRPFAAICVLYHSVFSDCVMSRPATASESAIGGIWLGEERVRLEEGARLEKRTKYTRPIFRTVVLRVRP